jgi:site-specific DNA recombinase
VRRPYGPQGFKDRQPGNGQGRTRRSQAEWIPVRVPALIDPALWERAQAQLAQNRERALRHNTQHPSLLRSLLVCGRCDRRMVGTWSAQGGRYLYALRYPRYVPGACTGRSLSATTIERWVWDHVKALLSDPAVLRRQYEQGGGDPARHVQADQEHVRLERKLTALDREVTRLIDAYQARVIELAELAERRHRIEDHGRMLRERVREIEQQRADRAAERRLLEGVDAFCASVWGALEDPAWEVQQKVI